MTNVYPFTRQDRAQDPRTLQFKIEAYQLVVRKYSPHLTAHEFIVLMQVLDRTAGWGELEASFTITALWKGDDVYGGFRAAMGRTKLFEALASLEAKGILQRRHDPRKFDKRHYRVNLQWTPGVAVILPKRLQNKDAKPSATRTTPSATRTDPSATRTLYTDSHSQVVLTDSHDDPASRAVVINLGEESRKKEGKPAARVRARHDGSTAARERTNTAEIDRGRSKRTAESVEHVWRDAVAEAFHGHPAPIWTVREKGQAKTALKKWRRPEVGFHDFMEWCARNWTAIMRKQFAWMTKQAPPSVPALPFLFSFMDGFIECYAENKLEAWLTSRDRTELERLMGQGNTYEQAMAEVARRKAAAGMREEMQKREANVRLRERTAKFTLQKAEKLMDLGAAPPHPRSVAAERARAAARAADSAARSADNPPPRGASIKTPDADFPEIMVPFVDAKNNPFDR